MLMVTQNRVKNINKAEGIVINLQSKFPLYHNTTKELLNKKKSLMIILG